MSNDKVKLPGAKPAAAAPAPTAKAQASTHVAPLFRRIDWITFLITFSVVMLGYYLTLAPDRTLGRENPTHIVSYLTT